MRTVQAFLCAALFCAALDAQTSAVTSAIYAQMFRAQTATGQSPIFSDVRGLGITNHVFEWTVSGAPAGCTLLIESSLDAITWSTASTNTCTLNGSVTLPDATYSFITVNLSVLSGGTNPAINVAYRGYLAGQGLPVRPAEGGTGSRIAFTPGSVAFATTSGVYAQDNAKFFWDDSNDRLCLLTNTCTNTLDVAGAKFYVTAAGLMGSYEATHRATSAGVVPATVQGAAAQTANLQEWKNSGGSVVASVSAAGVVTPTSGVFHTGRSRYSTVSIGSVAYASFGTSTTPVAGTLYCAEAFLPRNMTLTGIGVLNGGTVGTDKWIVALYGSAGGSVLANSALAGTTTSGANAFQEIAFTATYAAVGPARYWVCGQLNGTTDRLRTVAASTFIDVLTNSTAGSFGTMPSLTAPTTFAADVGPAAYIY
jgi:hypothetical protein